MTRRHALLSSALAGALALAACGEADDPGGPGPGPGGNPPAGYTAKEGSLSISDPALTVLGYDIWYPAERQNDPRAGQPSYVYLGIEEDGVALAGPTIAALPGGGDEQQLFKLESPSMTWEVTGQSTQGLTVVVNARLSYRFEIDDFEEELSVARVDLSVTDAGLESHFVLIADGCNGVAHGATITALVDGEPVGSPTSPWTIETRSVRADGMPGDGDNGPGCSW